MSDTNTEFDPLQAVTVREAAGLLHVSRPTVEKYVKTGELPSVKIGGCRRIMRYDLEDFLVCHRRRGWVPVRRRRGGSRQQQAETPSPLPYYPDDDDGVVARF